MLENLRILFFRQALKQMMSALKRRRQTHTLQSARTIGILFDAGNPAYRQEVLSIAESLRKQGKNLDMLGFFNLKQLPENLAFEAFSLKECAWNKAPKTPLAQTFATQAFDLLLYLNPDNQLPLQWIAIQSSAAMKIGTPAPEPNDLDMQLEIPADKGPVYFLEQLNHYLEKLS